MLGSSVWPKNSFLKTFAAVAIIVLIYVLIGIFVGNMLFHGGNKDYGHIFSSITEKQAFILALRVLCFLHRLIGCSPIFVSRSPRSFNVCNTSDYEF
mgnify:CR=1 FL=1